MICSGSAPLSGEVLQFLRVVTGAPCIEGYGQTETTALLCSQDQFDLDTGVVGSPSAAAEVKLVDVPEMSYFSTDRKHQSKE